MESTIDFSLSPSKAFTDQLDQQKKFVEQDYELKTLKMEVLELQNQLKLQELELKEYHSLQIKLPSDYNELKHSLERKDRKIQNLEEELKIKNSLMKTTEKGKNLEEFYKKKLESLNQELFEREKCLELNLEQKSVIENDLIRVSIENQNLTKQIKDFQGKSKKGKIMTDASFSKEHEDLISKSKRQELELSEMHCKIKEMNVF